LKEHLLWRPPNIKKLFPNSEAFIVSGKVIDRAMLMKGNAIALAANGRNIFVIEGVLRAAQRANAAVIIEIAKSEGGQKAYCDVNFWNIARIVDNLCNKLEISIPVAIHADHYAIKKFVEDFISATTEIPTMFEAGITSIAIDASHLPDDKNLLINIDLSKLIPAWAGYETEVGEIKGKEGLSTAEEALFLIQGLNANGVFPDWIALNNGTKHGIEESSSGIQVELTAQIHEALSKYEVSGAQHGTSGNSFERLQNIAIRTKTTKANVATALQMISWGVEVDHFGNAQLDDGGNFIRVPGEGVTDEIWAEMVTYAANKGWKKEDYKKLNLPFADKLLALPIDVRERMVRGVEDFAFFLITNVFHSQDTAPLAIEVISSEKSCVLGPKGTQIELLENWTHDKIIERSQGLNSNKKSEGNFDD